ncbi:MAG TPA: TIR domain-containing protein [Burkholderiaceae bacterium]|nr:TIR domain-containing protein [Burkholderiaceae bacterium]
MICTFYSYKGGVGRSMALANVADILSRRGLRVLMIDFDLEAPGIEQFFYRDDEREQRDAIRRQTGLLDLLLAYKDAMSVAGSGDGFRQLDRYIASIFTRRPGGGRLDLMPAGQRLTAEQLDRYALALRSFDWQDFYFNWEGDLFFEWLRRALIPERYDLVMVDSRTGVTEMGGICGYQLADLIVMLCGANHQNVDGTASMLDDFRSQARAGLRRGRPLEILVVPARVEQQSPQLLDAFYTRFEQRFGGLLPERVASQGLTFRDLAIPYDPLFAFEERVARGLGENATRERLAGVFGKLADVVAQLCAPGAATAAVAQYDETKRFAGFDVMLDAAHSDADAAERIARLLSSQGLRVHISTSSTRVGSDYRAVADEVLGQSQVLAVLLGPAPASAGATHVEQPAGATLTPHRRALVESALQARAAGRSLRIVPVLLPGFRDEPMVDPILQDLQSIDLRSGIDAPALARLAVDARAEAPGGAENARTEGGDETAAACDLAARVEIEAEVRCPWVGPVPFAEHQSDLLLGRDGELAQLLDLLETQPLTAIVGPSACGKTSLLRAGLLPRLRRRHPDWQIADATAAESPVPGAQTLAIFDDLQRGSAGGLAVDQPLAARFRELAAVGTRILVCLRSEQYPAWLRMQNEAGVELPHWYELKLPAEQALRQIVERPADAVGLAFEPGLVDRIVSRAVGERGVLPFLQVTLQRLWEQRRSGWLTNAAYDSFGGIRGVVTEAANRHFDSLDEAGQAEMKRILLRLVTTSGESTRAGVTNVPYASLAGAGYRVVATIATYTHVEGASPGSSVLAGLVDARLLVTSLDREEPMVELAHEALARDWPRMQLWLEQEREFLAWQRRLAAELETWQKAGRPADQLLRGAALAEATEMSAQHHLAPEEDRFIAASLTAERQRTVELERTRRRRLRVLATASVLFLAIAIVAGAGWYQKNQQSEMLRQRNALLQGQFDGLSRAREAAEQENRRAMARIAELQLTIDQALAATRAQVASTSDGAGSTTGTGAAASAGAAAGAADEGGGGGGGDPGRHPAAPAPAVPSALVVEQLERARAQAGRVAEYQADYTAAQVNNISRQQEALRKALPAARQ